jgi:hypothetical protein
MPSKHPQQGLDEVGVSRRAFLTAASVSSVGLAGCPWPSGEATTLPALTEGWADIRRDGSVGLVLRFDDDIQSVFKAPGVSEGNLISKASREGYSVSFRPANVPGTENLPDNQTVEAVVEDMVEVKSWPGGTQYVVENGFMLKKRAFEIEFEGQTVSVKFPTNYPIYHVLFPQGYQYLLPKDQWNANSTATDREFSGLFDYENYPLKRTIPKVTHYDTSIGAEMRAYDEYRYRNLHHIIKSNIYNPNWYQQRALSDIRKAISSIIKQLGRETLENIIITGLPQVLQKYSVIEDTDSIQDTITKNYTEVRSALSSLETWSEALLNEFWISEINKRLPPLRNRAKEDYQILNPLWTSAPSRKLAKQRLRCYLNSLNEQIKTINGYFEVDGLKSFRTATSYWRRLREAIESLLKQFRENISKRKNNMAKLYNLL